GGKLPVDASGGDTRPFSALAPGYGSNCNDISTKWQTAVMGNPAVIEFKLRPLSALFSGDLAAAISQALTAYASTALYVTSQFNIQGPYSPYVVSLSSQMLLNG